MESTPADAAERILPMSARVGRFLWALLALGESGLLDR